MSRKIPCPICGTPVDWSLKPKYRPFCSHRCKLIDLGEWIEEGRAIPGSELDPESLVTIEGDEPPAND